MFDRCRSALELAGLVAVILGTFEVVDAGDADGQETCGAVVLDVAQGLGLFAVGRIRFERGKARNRTWREVARRPLDWASRSLKREFEVVIMVEVMIEEMFGSD
jgi:hypothetical protein